MNWAKKINYKPLSRENAKYLIVGSAPAADDPECWDHGIIATAADENTAKQIMDEIHNCWGSHVVVMDNHYSSLEVVRELVSSMMDEPGLE